MELERINSPIPTIGTGEVNDYIQEEQPGKRKGHGEARVSCNSPFLFQGFGEGQTQQAYKTREHQTSLPKRPPRAIWLTNLLFIFRQILPQSLLVNQPRNAMDIKVQKYDCRGDIG